MLDFTLALAELLLVPTALLALGLAARRGLPVLPAVALAAVVGVTLAFPIGVVADFLDEEETRQVLARPELEQAELGKLRKIAVGPVPLALFRLETRRIGEEVPWRTSDGVGDLRLRYLTLPLATGSTMVSPLLTTYPPEDHDDPWGLRIIPDGSGYLLAGHTASAAGEIERAYRLHLGVASSTAVFYWLIALPLAVLALRRRHGASQS